LLNLKPYELVESCTGIKKLIYLPYNVQLHKSDKQGEYFIVNAFRLIPNEEPVINKELSTGAEKELL
jgi:predicted RNA-binding protein